MHTTIGEGQALMNQGGVGKGKFQKYTFKKKPDKKYVDAKQDDILWAHFLIWWRLRVRIGADPGPSQVP